MGPEESSPTVPGSQTIIPEPRTMVRGFPITMSKIHASTEPRQVSGGIVDGPHPGSSRARQPRAEGCAAHLWLLVGMRRWASSICLTTRFHVCGTSFQTRSTVTLGLVVLLGGVVGHGDARPVAVAQNHPPTNRLPRRGDFPQPRVAASAATLGDRPTNMPRTLSGFLSARCDGRSMGHHDRRASKAILTG